MNSSPYEHLPAVPRLALRSDDVVHGRTLPTPHLSASSGVAGAADLSPHLAWSDAPAGTKSFLVTMYDPDAPTPSGFWHWAVADLPATTLELERGASQRPLAGAAFHVLNDARAPIYIGAAPPPGTGRHRYFIAVSALDVASVKDLGFPTDGTPALLGFLTLGHVLARGILVPEAGEGA